jgi:hypothetical protein
MIFWGVLLPTPAESLGFYATLPEQCGVVEVVEKQALCKGAAASYSHLIEHVRALFTSPICKISWTNS